MPPKTPVKKKADKKPTKKPAKKPAGTIKKMTNTQIVNVSVNTPNAPKQTRRKRASKQPTSEISLGDYSRARVSAFREQVPPSTSYITPQGDIMTPLSKLLGGLKHHPTENLTPVEMRNKWANYTNASPKNTYSLYDDIESNSVYGSDKGLTLDDLSNMTHATIKPLKKDDVSTNKKHDESFNLDDLSDTTHTTIAKPSNFSDDISELSSGSAMSKGSKKLQNAIKRKKAEIAKKGPKTPNVIFANPSAGSISGGTTDNIASIGKYDVPDNISTKSGSSSGSSGGSLTGKTMRGLEREIGKLTPLIKKEDMARGPKLRGVAIPGRKGLFSPNSPEAKDYFASVKLIEDVIKS